MQNRRSSTKICKGKSTIKSRNKKIQPKIARIITNRELEQKYEKSKL